jgi:hypothetical protein
MPKTKLEQELSKADSIYVLSEDGEPLMPSALPALERVQ